MAPALSANLGSPASKEIRAYSVAYAALTGFVFFAILPFTVLAISKTHRRRDSARRFVPWMKATFIIFTLSMCLLFIRNVMNAVFVHHPSMLNEPSFRAANHIGYLGNLFATISAATAMVFLLLLSPDMHYAIKGVNSGFDKAIKVFALCIAAVVIALAISIYGLMVHYFVDKRNQTSDVLDLFNTTNDLTGAVAVILFFTSLVITSLSVFTFIKRRISPLKTASMMYLMASLLNLVSATWNFAYAVHWIFMKASSNDLLWTSILTIILSYWSRGALLIISYFVAKRSRAQGGIWSDTGKYDSADSGVRNGHH